jgi:pyrimidine-nucleoside phosphorylase
MRAVDIITKKRDGEELSREELEFFVNGFTRGDIPDYQVSAWAMAVLLRGMTERETTDLTMAMANSGDTLDLNQIAPNTVDKHSTGGVGDKTSITVLPLVASCGLKVSKMSGRGLGFTGGTLDKLESIPGYRVNLTKQEFLDQLASFGLVLSGQSADLAPADGKLYSLRDVTGTVQSLPLIASSVMSKKLAAGASAFVLDVKTGVGAFMQSLDEARKLSHLMVKIGELCGKRVVCLLTDMNQPLGSAVGNALELREAVETLQGKGPVDYTEHCLTVGSYMLVLGSQAKDLQEARVKLEEVIRNGKAFAKFRDLVNIQQGDTRYVDNLDLLPRAKYIEAIPAPNAGYIHSINAKEVGETSVDLGAGRAKKGDPVDHAVGIMILHKVGDKVEKGEPLFALHANDMDRLEQAKQRLLQVHVIKDEPCKPLTHQYGVIQ